MGGRGGNPLTDKIRKVVFDGFPYQLRFVQLMTPFFLVASCLLSSDACLASSVLLPCNSALSSNLYFQRNSQKVAELIPSLSGEKKRLNYFLKIVGETKVLANHVILNKQVAMKVATLH